MSTLIACIHKTMLNFWTGSPFDLSGKYVRKISNSMIDFLVLFGANKYIASAHLYLPFSVMSYSYTRCTIFTLTRNKREKNLTAILTSEMVLWPCFHQLVAILNKPKKYPNTVQNIYSGVLILTFK